MSGWQTADRPRVKETAEAAAQAPARIPTSAAAAGRQGASVPVVRAPGAGARGAAVRRSGAVRARQHGARSTGDGPMVAAVLVARSLRRLGGLRAGGAAPATLSGRARRETNARQAERMRAVAPEAEGPAAVAPKPVAREAEGSAAVVPKPVAREGEGPEAVALEAVNGVRVRRRDRVGPGTRAADRRGERERLQQRKSPVARRRPALPARGSSGGRTSRRFRPTLTCASWTERYAPNCAASRRTWRRSSGDTW